MVRYDWRERYQSATEAKKALASLIDRPKASSKTKAKAKAKIKPKITTNFDTYYSLDEPNIIRSCLWRILILAVLFAFGMIGMASVDRWQNFMRAAKFYDRGVSLSGDRNYEQALDLYYLS